MQNYKVVGVRWFGAYKQGAVLPEWAVARAGNVAELVERGILEKTIEPVNVEVTVPAPKVVNDPAPSVVDESNRLRAENGSLTADVRSLTAQVSALQEQLKARDVALGKQTEVIEHLRSACEGHQKRIAELEKTSDSVTQPPPQQQQSNKKPQTQSRAAA